VSNQTAGVIAYIGKIATQNEQRSIVEAGAIRDGKYPEMNSACGIRGIHGILAIHGSETAIYRLPLLFS
jgi:hypothetical protein